VNVRLVELTLQFEGGSSSRNVVVSALRSPCATQAAEAASQVETARGGAGSGACEGEGEGPPETVGDEPLLLVFGETCAPGASLQVMRAHRNVALEGVQQAAHEVACSLQRMRWRAACSA
jgi:hypothetical protein